MEVPKRELSYRLYGRLSSKDKQRLDKSNITPIRKLLAMFTKKKHGISMNKAIREAKKIDILGLTLKFKIECQEYAIREFKFRGFIPISQYKKFNPNYPHVTTNFKIQGEYWIYPKRFGNNFYQLQKGYEPIHNVFMEYGVQGYTRILYGKH